MLKVMQEVVLKSDEPMRVAREFVRCTMAAEGAMGVFEVHGDFRVWKGGKWQVVSGEGVEAEVWRWLENARVEGMDREGNPTVRRFKPNRGRVGDVVAALRAQTRVEEVVVGPLWLGETPFPSGDVGATVAFEDRLVTCGAGGVVTMERDWRWFDHVVLPVKWEPEARCPRWERAVREWADGDEKWGRLLQRWFGYCLSSGRKYQRMMMDVGRIRSGKDTRVGVLRKLLGDRAVFETGMESLASPFGLAGAEYARVMVLGEMGKATGPVAESAGRTLKCVVGGTKTDVQAKYKPIERLVLATAPMVTCNEIPALPNRGQGLSGKMLILPNTVSFVGREDFGLAEALQGELAGIAAWAVRGLVELEGEQEAGKKWPKPAAADDVAKKFTLQNNPADSFLEDRFVRNGEGFVASEFLWGIWLEWKRDNEVRVHMTPREFGFWLEGETSWDLWRKRDKDGGLRGWGGLSAKVS